MDFVYAFTVFALVMCLTFEGCGFQASAQLAPKGSAFIETKKEEFANNLKNCVAIQSLDTCLGKILEDLRLLMPTGIPELDLRPTEPLKIENIQFKTRPGIGVQIDSEFSNVIVRHLSNFVTNRISADLDQRTLFISLTVPIVQIRGNYRVDGNVFVFQISGNGPFMATLSGVTGVGSAAIEPVGPPGNKKLSIKRTNIDFDIASAQVQLDNLFDGRAPAVAKTVNDFINQNSGLIINEVKPQIREQVTGLVQSVMNDAFSQLPADDFLEKLPIELRSVPLPRANVPIPSGRPIGGPIVPILPHGASSRSRSRRRMRKFASRH